jgi:hypothetical protein
LNRGWKKFYYDFKRPEEVHRVRWVKKTFFNAEYDELQDENGRKVQYAVLISNEQMKKKLVENFEHRHWLARMWLGKPKASLNEGSWSEDVLESGEGKVYGVCIDGQWFFSKEGNVG